MPDETPTLQWVPQPAGMAALFYNGLLRLVLNREKDVSGRTTWVPSVVGAVGGVRDERGYERAEDAVLAAYRLAWQVLEDAQGQLEAFAAADVQVEGADRDEATTPA